MTKKDLNTMINFLESLKDDELDNISMEIKFNNVNSIENGKRHLLTKVSHLLYEKNYNVSLDGNLSYRLSDNEILISPSRIHKGFIKPSDFIVIDYSGNLIKGSRKPSSEYRLHTEIYNKRPDINAVIHAHSPYAIAVSLAGINLEEMYITQPPIPTTEFALPSSKESPEKMEKFIMDYNWGILNRHGAVTYGVDIWEAFYRLEELEQVSKIVLSAYTQGNLTPIDENNKKRLLELFNSIKDIKS